MQDDFGFFGKGISGYIHYTLANERNNGGGNRSGGKDGCLTSLLLIAALTCLPALLRL